MLVRGAGWDWSRGRICRAPRTSGSRVVLGAWRRYGIGARYGVLRRRCNVGGPDGSAAAKEVGMVIGVGAAGKLEVQEAGSGQGRMASRPLAMAFARASLSDSPKVQQTALFCHQNSWSRSFRQCHSRRCGRKPVGPEGASGRCRTVPRFCLWPGDSEPREGRLPAP